MRGGLGSKMVSGAGNKTDGEKEEGAFREKGGEEEEEEKRE